MIPTPPFSSLDFFHTKIFPSQKRITSRNFSVIWHWELLIEVRDTPFYAKIFSKKEILSNRKMSPTKFIGEMNEKSLLTESRNNTPSPIHISIHTRIFRKHKMVPHEISSHCWTRKLENFDRNSWHHLLCIKFFEAPKIRKARRVPHDLFRHCETKNFRRKIAIPPFLSKNFFRTRTFLKQKGAPRSFSALWD